MRKRKVVGWEHLWNKIYLKGSDYRKTHEHKIKRSGQARLVYVYVFEINHSIRATASQPAVTRDKEYAENLKCHIECIVLKLTTL